MLSSANTPRPPRPWQSQRLRRVLARFVAVTDHRNLETLGQVLIGMEVLSTDAGPDNGNARSCAGPAAARALCSVLVGHGLRHQSQFTDFETVRLTHRGFRRSRTSAASRAK